MARTAGHDQDAEHGVGLDDLGLTQNPTVTRCPGPSRWIRGSRAHDAFWAAARRTHGDTGGTRALVEVLLHRTSGIQQTLAGRAVMADGGYRGNPEVTIPSREPTDGSDLPDRKQHLNHEHRTIRARIEHTLARTKHWKILRDYRRAGRSLTPPSSDPRTCNTP